MDNYEAILRMDRTAMEGFLDQVYLAGMNAGLYAARLPHESEEQFEVLDENPFDSNWLSDEAEHAVLGTIADDGDEYLLDALTAAVFRNAGIEPKEEGEPDDGDIDP